MNMQVSLSIQSAQGRTWVSCRAFWVSGKGMHSAELCCRREVHSDAAGSEDPWVLLAEAYRQLAEIKGLRATD